jgi:hypothetical protein
MPNSTFRIQKSANGRVAPPSVSYLLDIVELAHLIVVFERLYVAFGAAASNSLRHSGVRVGNEALR